MFRDFEWSNFRSPLYYINFISNLNSEILTCLNLIRRKSRLRPPCKRNLPIPQLWKEKKLNLKYCPNRVVSLLHILPLVSLFCQCYNNELSFFRWFSTNLSIFFKQNFWLMYPYLPLFVDLLPFWLNFVVKSHCKMQVSFGNLVAKFWLDNIEKTVKLQAMKSKSFFWRNRLNFISVLT